MAGLKRYVVAILEHGSAVTRFLAGVVKRHARVIEDIDQVSS